MSSAPSTTPDDAIASSATSPDTTAAAPAPAGNGLPPNVREMRSKTGRVSYQGDFRAFPLLGGRRVILCEPGSKEPIRCPERAKARYEELLDNYRNTAKNVAYHKLSWDPRLGHAARNHLIAKAITGDHAETTLDAENGILKRFVRELDNPRLSDITGPRLEQRMLERAKEPGARTGTSVSKQTIRNELMALSALYVRCMKWRVIDYNPVDDVTTKPKTARDAGQVTWLTPAEAARLLDAAARLDAETRAAILAVTAYKDERSRGCATCALPEATYAAARRFAWCEAVIATMRYTGGRLMEVLGLPVEDLDFDGQRVYFRANDHRGLKKFHHRRKVEFWRPLRDTLRHYLSETGRKSGLLFTTADGRLMRAFAKPLRRCLEAAGLAQRGRHLTCHSLRHSFATRLLATMVRGEAGQWVERSTDSVRRRLGHRTTYLVETRYGHDTDGVRRTKRLSFEQGRALPAKRLRTEARSEVIVLTLRAVAARQMERRGHLWLVA